MSFPYEDLGVSRKPSGVHLDNFFQVRAKLEYHLAAAGESRYGKEPAPGYAKAGNGKLVQSNTHKLTEKD